METAQVAVVVLSPEFVSRRWPMRELLCFLRRREETTGNLPLPVIVPFFYRLSVSELYEEPRIDRVNSSGQSLYEQSRFVERMIAGEPEANIATIKVALQKVHSIMGVRNDLDATNHSSYEMHKRRELLLQELCLCASEAVQARSSSENTPSRDRRVDIDDFQTYYYPARGTSMLVHSFYEEDQNQHADTQEGRLLRIVEDKSADANRVIVVHGIGGVGKTSVLQGLSKLDQLKHAFEDGIHLIPLGMDANEQDLIAALSVAVERAGGRQTARKMRAERDWRDVIQSFRSWFAERQCLFLVDDVQTHEITSGMIHELLMLHESGRDSKVLMTTRSLDIAARAYTSFCFEPCTPVSSVARSILVRYADIVPSKEDLVESEVVRMILERCCGLPLFLAIAGRAVRTLSLRKGCKGALAYHVYAKSLDASMRDFINTDIDSYQRLQSTLSLSIQLIEGGADNFAFSISLTMAEMYRRLSVLEKQERVPLSMLRYLWELSNEAEAAIVARKFELMALVDMEIESDESGYKETLSFHDSLHLFASTETARHHELNVVNEALLRGYGEGLDSTDGLPKWWSTELQVDGYMPKRLCKHLLASGRGPELVRLLLTPHWTVRQFEINGILVVEDDYSLGAKAVQDGVDVHGFGNFSTVETLRLISEAARLSSPFAKEFPRQMWFLLSARLKGEAIKLKGIRGYLNQTEEGAPRPWLRPLNCFLTPAGSPNTKIYPFLCSVLCMATLDHERKIACGLSNGKILIINMLTGETYSEWQAHDERVEDIAVDKSEGRIVSGSSRGAVKVWEVDTHRCLATFEGHEGTVGFIEVIGDGNRVISSDGVPRLWDIYTGQEILEAFRDHEAPVCSLAVFRDGVHVIMGGRDGALRLWNTETGAQEGAAYIGHHKSVTSIVVFPEERRILSCSSDGTLIIWHVASRKEITVLRVPSLRDCSGICCLSADGARIAFTNSGWIHVWDLESNSEFCDPFGSNSWQDHVQGLTFLSDSDFLVSCSSDGKVRVWNLHRRDVLRSVRSKGDTVISLCFTPDGKHVVSGSRGANVQVWDATSGQPVSPPICRHCELVTFVMVTDDGKYIYSESQDQTSRRLWDFQSLKVLHRFDGSTPAIEGATAGSEDRYNLEQILEQAKLAPQKRATRTRRLGLTIPTIYDYIWHDRESQVLATFESEISTWDVSPVGNVICVALEDGQLAFMELEE